MKKIFYLLLAIFLITGCSKEKNSQVTSIIKKENNTVIAIHYPEFHYPKLDRVVKKEIDTIKTNFEKKKENNKELNIAYQYNILNNRYINLLLTIYTRDSTSSTPTNQVRTFCYDIKRKKILSLNDILSNEELKKLIPKIKTTLVKQYQNCFDFNVLNQIITPDFQQFSYFYFDDNDITFYFDTKELNCNYDNFISAKISLDLVNLSIPLERGVWKEEEVLLPEIKKRPIDCKKPMIALTFDDGPSKYTDSILKLLKKYNARATFFIIGNKVSLYQDTLRTMVENGNEIGNHSYDHKWLTKVTDDELVNQINTTQNLVKETTGMTPKLFRPTYGSINHHLREKISLDIIMWTLDTSDWKTSNPKKIAQYTLNTIKKNDIVLMHDTHKQTYEALKIILPELKKKGYQFVTVSELNEVCTSK